MTTHPGFTGTAKLEKMHNLTIINRTTIFSFRFQFFTSIPMIPKVFSGA